MRTKINNISIGLPCYNEEKNINNVINKCVLFIRKNNIKNWELLIIDNKSNDKTVKIVNEIIKKHKSGKIRLIKNQKNILYSGSVNKIIKQAKYDLIVIMDSDDQYLPSDISKLYNHMKKNKLELVFGRRKIRKDTITRKIISAFFLYISRVLINNRINDLNCGLRILKRNELISKYIQNKLNFCNPELYVRYNSLNLKIGQAKISHFHRDHGKSIHNIFNLLNTTILVIYYLIKLRKLNN